jgi:hypothetical protein
MSGPRLAFAAVLIVVLGRSSPIQAQNSVPGGWDDQVSYQTFHSPDEGGVVTGFGGFGAGAGDWSSWAGGTSTVRGPIARSAVGASLPLYQMPQPQVYNALVPLGDTLRKSVRKRSKR